MEARGGDDRHPADDQSCSERSGFAFRETQLAHRHVRPPEEVRPGVAVDFEIVSDNGNITFSNDGYSIMSDPRYETRELGLFLLFEKARDSFTRADVYNLKRDHQFSNYPVYWAGKATNEESLNYLKSIIDSTSPEVNRLSDRAAYAIALHDDARVEGILTELIKRPASESIRNRALYWLGYTPESQAKSSLLTEIVRNQRESGDARQNAMTALGLSRAATTLPVLENLYETMTPRELKRLALVGIGRCSWQVPANVNFLRSATAASQLLPDSSGTVTNPLATRRVTTVSGGTCAFGAGDEPATTFCLGRSTLN